MESDKNAIKEMTENHGELVLILDETGKIIRNIEGWTEFGKEHGLPEKYWKNSVNFFNFIKEFGKGDELRTLQKVIGKDLKEYLDIIPVILKDNSLQWFSIKARPMKTLNENLNGTVISLKLVNLHTIQAITAESVLENMDEGFALLDENYKIHYLNAYGEEVLKSPREENVGMNWWDLFPDALGSKFHQEFDKVILKGTSVHFEEYYEPLSTWFRLNAYPLSSGGMALYFQNINERKVTEEKLWEYAYTDFLTGLPNRRAMSELAKSLVQSKTKFTLFFINLDNLKVVNAMHNFNSGDKVLASVAAKLKELAGPYSKIGRLDGDEFVVIRQPQGKERLENFAENLKEIFMHPFQLENQQSVNIAASIGIACYPYDAQNLGEVLSFAETAMFEAKKTKETSYCFFRKAMNSERERKIKIEKGLQEDLKENGYYFTLQPQIDGATGKVIGVEILSRWNHPELGELSPLEFIQVAEQSSTIVSLTTHLLHEVFTQLKEWQKRYGWNLKTAINMTPSLLGNPEFFKDFFALIDRYEIQPELIEIEITEQAELTYSDCTLENLQLCKSKCISIAIDDFGTGFSMIAYLTQFPINKIKLDKFFIQKIGEDKKSEAVLASLIHLAKSIECELLAEGVERVEEVDFLKEHDCIHFQGYYFDKPLTVADFEEKYLR
ncbi:Cyclic di-GMP phosphodiesterase Gmr [Planococcus massiliensis]|uniref:Cyclic di-GMP phosphodiesterase Gmr n=1 Tax=Planococcus massiliensis TaxID=1499687 RepID=A0A098ELJ8_9BACL|nr:bifunctional diguanylate cyclase/phosphodiesterase [Planococcus massiliensis]CEG22146.1 Cyclic di-GMP phosphodiesterase Gmr [Planococcus massiliensis]